MVLSTLNDGTLQRVRKVQQLGFRLAVVCSLSLAFAAATFVCDGAMPSAQGSDVIANTLHLCNVTLDGLLRGRTVRTVRTSQHAGHVRTGIWRIQH